MPELPELPDVPPTTEDVLRRSRLHRVPGVYVVARCAGVGDATRHLIVTRDELETTVITRPEHLADCEVLERNPDAWVLLGIDCANPFYCVGFLARLTSALAAAGIDVLACSTFTRDSLLVQEAQAERAIAALRAAGLEAAFAPDTGDGRRGPAAESRPLRPPR